MSKEYPEKMEFMGHTGTHIRDGVYKVDEPFEVFDMEEDLPSFGDEWGIGFILHSPDSKSMCTVHYFAVGRKEKGNLVFFVEDLPGYDLDNELGYHHHISIGGSNLGVMGVSVDERRDSNMSKEYPEKAEFMGHLGTHIRDGIYKVDEPFEIFDMDDDLPSFDEEWGVGFKPYPDTDDGAVCKIYYFAWGYSEKGSLACFIQSLPEFDINNEFSINCSISVGSAMVGMMGVCV